jgi:hypothetical protein
MACHAQGVGISSVPVVKYWYVDCLRGRIYKDFPVTGEDQKLSVSSSPNSPDGTTGAFVSIDRREVKDIVKADHLVRIDL